MMELPRNYVVMSARSWGLAISGPVLAVAGLFLLLAQLTITDGTSEAKKLLRDCGWAVLAIAGLMVFPAQYEVWKQELERRTKAEDELDAAADIRGTILVTPDSYNPYADQKRPGSSLKITCDCANHVRRECQISKLEIVLKGDSLETQPKACLLNQPVLVGVGQCLRLEDRFLISGVTPEQLAGAVDIQVVLTDSLGTRYPNTTTMRASASERT